MFDVVFWALSFVCCLALPSLLLALPSVLVALATIRRRPEWRTRAAIAAGVANGLGSSALHALAGFVVGTDVGEGSTAISVGVAAGGLAGGFLLGLALTYAAVLVATRPRAAGEITPPPDHLGAWALGLAIATLVLGVATSIAGLGFSVSIGMISLALASMVVRPIALTFVVLHLLGTLGAALAWRAGARPVRAGLAVTVSALGLLLASSIAAFGPDFFDRLLEGAAHGLGAVT